MKNLILIAPPAAGKGTLASLISEKYNIPTISVGELMRQARDPETEIGRIIIQCQDNRTLVPLDITLELLKERITKEDCNNGYILDGFPRSIEQANAYQEILNQLGRDLGMVVFLDIDKELALKRTMSRIVCPKCGKTYNLLVDSLKPQEEGICDDCHTNLTRRSDDTEETFYKGFETYINNTLDLINYYEEKNVLVKLQAAEDVTPEDLLKQLEGNF